MVLDEVLLDLLPVLGHTRTRHHNVYQSGALKFVRQSSDTNTRFSRLFFSNEALHAVLHLSKLSDQLDVKLGSSKIAKKNWLSLA
jgi:hypothetical protein